MGEVLSPKFNPRGIPANDNDVAIILAPLDSNQYSIGQLVKNIEQRIQSRIEKFNPFLTALSCLHYSDRYTVSEANKISEEDHRFIFTMDEDDNIAFEIMIAGNEIIITDFMATEVIDFSRNNCKRYEPTDRFTNQREAFDHLKDLIEAYEPSFDTHSVKIIAQARNSMNAPSPIRAYNFD